MVGSEVVEIWTGWDRICLYRQDTNTQIEVITRGKSLMFCSLGLMVILQTFVVFPHEIQAGVTDQSMILYICTIQYSAHVFAGWRKLTIP